MTRKNAFVGPRPFPQDRQLYGRDRELFALTNQLLAERLVLMYSPSGAGKSSMILAKGALRDRMTEEGFVVLPVVRVNECAVVARQLGVNRYLLSLLQSLETARSEADRRLVEVLAGVIRAGSGDGILDEYLTNLTQPGQQPLLILDQFEEFLTHDPTDLEQKKAFLRQLAVALKTPDRWALFAMREDYVGTLEPYLPLLPTRLAATFRLDFLRMDAAREAALKPPAEEEFRVTFAEDAVAKLLGDLARVSVQDPITGEKTEKDSQYVEPLHLQVVCERIWDRRDPKPGDVITLQDVQAYQCADVSGLTGVAAAMAEYYAKAVTEVATQFRDQGITERAIRKWFDSALISENGLRVPVLLGTEQEYRLNPAVLQALAARYLIRSEPRNGAIYYELSHDRFVVPVQKSNEYWRTKQSPFQQAADLYHKNDANPNFLARGDVLDAGIRESEAAGDAFPPDDAKFLTASLGARKVRRLVGGVVVMGAVLGLVLGGIILYWVDDARYQAEQKRTEDAKQAQAKLDKQRDEDRQAKERAIQETKEKEQSRQVDTLKMLTLAQSHYMTAIGKLTDEPALAAIEAQKALDAFMASDAKQIPDDLLKYVLPRSLANQRMVTLPKMHRGSILDIQFDATGNWVFTRGSDEVIYYWWCDHARRPQMAGTFFNATVMMMHPAGQTVFVGHSNGRVCEWGRFTDDPNSKIDLSDIQKATYSPVTSIDIKQYAGQSRLAVGHADGTVKVYDLDTRKLLADWKAGAGSVANLAMSPLPIVLLTDTQDGEIRSWNIRNLTPGGNKPELAQEPLRIRESVNRLAISPTAEVFAVGTTNAKVKLFWMSSKDKQIGIELPDPLKLPSHKPWSGAVNLLSFGRYDPSRPNTNFLLGATSDRAAGLYVLERERGDPLWKTYYRGDLGTMKPGRSKAEWTPGHQQELRPTPWTRAVPVLARDPIRPYEADTKLSVQSATFSDTSKMIAAGSADGIVYVWKTDSLNTPVVRYVSSASPISAVGFTPTRGGFRDRLLQQNSPRWLYTGTLDGTVRRWDLDLYESEETIGEQLQNSKSANQDLRAKVESMINRK